MAPSLDVAQSSLSRQPAWSGVYLQHQIKEEERAKEGRHSASTCLRCVGGGGGGKGAGASTIVWSCKRAFLSFLIPRETLWWLIIK